MIASLLLAGACAANLNAQEKTNYYTPKWSDNIFVSVGGGVHAINNDGFNKLAPHFSVSIGKLITPTWGVRAQIGGFQQKIGAQKTGYKGDSKTAFELNLDAMLNLTNLIGGYNPDRAIDLYAFVGPTMNLSNAVNTSIIVTPNSSSQTASFSEGGTKARLGATAGIGLGYNVNEKWAINLEGRFGITPSIFGNASDFNKAEGTGRLTIGATYTFGGKKFVKGGESKVIEKVVEKEIIKEVPVEVVKEIIKEVPSAASAAIFFKIGKAVISPEGMVNVKLMAKTMKTNPTTKYKVAGFADKGTGSVAANQTLSEKRAQAVYDALIAEGISADRLEKDVMGGTDPMFESGYLNRVVILEVK